jgi:hypothetical protein
MTTAGWIIMTVSIASVVTLVTFCYYRVLTGSSRNQSLQDPRSNPMGGDRSDTKA